MAQGKALPLHYTWIFSEFSERILGDFRCRFQIVNESEIVIFLMITVLDIEVSNYKMLKFCPSIQILCSLLFVLNFHFLLKQPS